MFALPATINAARLLAIAISLTIFPFKVETSKALASTTVSAGEGSLRSARG